MTYKMKEGIESTKEITEKEKVDLEKDQIVLL